MLIAFPLLVSCLQICCNMCIVCWRVELITGFEISSWVFCPQAYGFTSQQFLFSVYGTLRAPSVQRMTAVVKQVGLDRPGFNTWHRAMRCCGASDLRHFRH